MFSTPPTPLNSSQARAALFPTLIASCRHAPSRSATKTLAIAEPPAYVNWVPGAHVRLENLDFIVTTVGELGQAPITVQPLHSAGLDAIVEALEELRLHAPEAHALGATSSSASITGG